MSARRFTAAEVEKKRVAVLARVEAAGGTRSDNPHLAEYREKLVELADRQVAARDAFINWLTGLSAGGMSLAFTSLEKANGFVAVVALCAGCVFLLALVAAIAFKLCLEVRDSGIQTEVCILAAMFHSHDAQQILERMIARGAQPDDKTEQRFLAAMNDQLDLLDPEQSKVHSGPTASREKWLARWYVACVGLFLLGAVLLALRYGLSL